MNQNFSVLMTEGTSLKIATFGELLFRSLKSLNFREHLTREYLAGD